MFVLYVSPQSMSVPYYLSRANLYEKYRKMIVLSIPLVKLNIALTKSLAGMIVINAPMKLAFRYIQAKIRQEPCQS